MRGTKGIKRHNAVFHLFKNASKNAQVKIWPFLVIFRIFGPLPPLEKNRFLAPPPLCMERLATAPVFQKTSCGTLFRIPKGPISKKKHQEDGMRKLSEHQIRCHVVRFA